MKYLLKNRGILAVIMLSLVSISAQGGETLAARQSPRFIVNLMDYVGADYPGAVENGRIKSQSEYSEQLEFVAAALKVARELPETRSDPGILSKITSLQKLVQDKAPAERVSAAAQQAKLDVIRVTGIRISPTRWPNLKNGAQLFAQNCAACHGVTGHGDGPAATGLTPAPANFHAESMKESSPFKSFNVIRVGVPGTSMAPFNSLSDNEAWDLAFYVNSLRHEGSKSAEATAIVPADDRLPEVSVKNDVELAASLQGSDAEKARQLVALRTWSGQDDEKSALSVARANLKDSGDHYRRGDFDAAKTSALKAYLEGVEPVEPKLKANDPQFTSSLEERMGLVRSAIEARKSPAAVAEAIGVAGQALDQAEKILATPASSPWVTFMIASGILLREGFEAVLILIALLAVIRASGSRKAAAWVHGGWISALALGGVAWIFSGWLMGISGAHREMMEAVISIFAVGVLLYMGFWLHSRTEIHRWKQFIDVRVKSALAGGNLFGLAVISFMAVFREAFETVLFLRAVWLDGGDSEKFAMGAGVFGSLAFILICAWALLRYSANLPIRKVFSISSVLMILLAVILAGKGTHAFQETGTVAVNALSLGFRSDIFGIFPTRETILAQLVVLAVSVTLWMVGKKPPRKSAPLSSPAVSGN